MTQQFFGLRNKKVMLLIAGALFIFLFAGITQAFFVDRESHQMQFKTSAFNSEGYDLAQVAPEGPFIAGEDVTIYLSESNAGTEEDLLSTITMTAEWISPDTSSNIFGNSKGSDIATFTISGDGLEAAENISYAVNEDGTATFELPSHLLTRGTSGLERSLMLHIPESLTSTGSIKLTYDKVAVSQAPHGFVNEYSVDESLDFSIPVGWAASDIQANNGKALMGYLSNDCSGIRFEFAFGYTESGMWNFTSDTESKWSHYKDTITNITFPDDGHIVSIGDYSFKDFVGITELSLPDTVTRIGAHAFDNISISGLALPSKLTNLGAMAFGHIEELVDISFSGAETAKYSFPAAGSSTGAFYIGEPYSVSAPLSTVITGKNDDIKAYEWLQDHRVIKMPVSIKIITEPNKTDYMPGEDFNPSGLVVEITYSDGSTKEISDPSELNIAGGDNLPDGTTKVTISYSEYEETVSSDIPVTVRKPVSIEVITPPTKTDYAPGEDFDPSGIIVEVTYSDGSTKEIGPSDLIIDGGENLQDGTSDVNISYKEGDTTVSITVPITVKVVSSLKIISPPVKTNYIAGEDFDPSGMVVEVAYSDGTSKEISDPSEYVVGGEDMAEDTSKVTVSYTENGNTVSVDVAVSVTNPPTAISVVTQPKKTQYGVGESFDSTNMVIEATYADGSKKDITNYTVVDGDILKKGQTEVTISYEKDGVTVTTTVPITVSIMWKRYNINTSYSHEIETVSELSLSNSAISSKKFTGITDWGTSYSLNESTGEITFSKSMDSDDSSSSSYISMIERYGNEVKSLYMWDGSSLYRVAITGDWKEVYRYDNWYTYSASASLMAYISGSTYTVSTSVDNDYTAASKSGVAEYRVKTNSSQTQGTYIDIVYAEEGTYPDNGIQDGYWYVKQ